MPQARLLREIKNAKEPRSCGRGSPRLSRRYFSVGDEADDAAENAAFVATRNSSRKRKRCLLVAGRHPPWLQTQEGRSSPQGRRGARKKVDSAGPEEYRLQHARRVIFLLPILLFLISSVVLSMLSGPMEMDWSAFWTAQLFFQLVRFLFCLHRRPRLLYPRVLFAGPIQFDVNPIPSWIHPLTVYFVVRLTRRLRNVFGDSRSGLCCDGFSCRQMPLYTSRCNLTRP